ncbi:hypothetical protein R6I18_22665 (plasmid) [Escherichia coli]|nr:hypothetical protein [Escherichia coli]WOY70592.1 hypothetical protein R6I18_22665 [Escherichia coli]
MTYIYRGKDVLKGHVGQEEEDGSVDIHHTHLRELLAQKDEANQDGNHLQIKMLLASH